MNDARGADTEPSPDQQTIPRQRQALPEALADQEQRWRSGTPLPVEHYLERDPALAADVEGVLDLIYKEVLLRTERGDLPQFEEYARRFPQLLDALGPIFEIHRALEADAVHTTPPGAVAASQAAPARRTPAPPDLPGYELMERLGQGGMGVVYKARQKSLDRTVALKMVLAGAHASPDERARFGREAEVVAKLAHPNIVQVFEVGEHEGRPFLALEYVDGGGLDKKLRGTPQPPGESAQLIETLARAVHHAHLQGVVHRDLKPANVLLTGSGIAKIADFGLARLGAGSGQTQSGDVLGTPSYMAPEQATGQNSAIGPATDVYALGATLYELLTGRPPFRADNPIETLLQVSEQEPISPSRLRPNVPRDLETICLKCLQKAPEKRYASAEALADDLRRFLDGHPILARPTPAWERALKWARRRPALAALYTVSAAAVVAIVFYNVFLQSAFTDANNQRIAAQKARTAAENALEERRQQLVQARLAEGTRFLEDGDWFGALLPFADAARLDQKDPNRAAIHGVRLNTILRQCPRLVQFWRHDGEARFSEFSPDGGHVLTVAGDLARLWDVATGKEVSRLSHGKEIVATALSADGRLVATAADDRTVDIWAAVTGRLLGQVPLGDDDILRVAFVGDQVAIATRKAEYEIRIQVWDVSAGKAVSPALDAHTGVLFDVVFSPDGRRALTGGATPVVWAVAEGRAIFEVRGSPLLNQARFSADGRLVAGADVSGAVRVWDAATGKEVASVRHAPPVRDVTFSPDGRFLVTGGADGVARVWQLPAGGLAVEIRHGLAFTHAVTQVAFSPDGRHQILVASVDNTARVWVGNSPATPLLRHGDRVTRASFSPDGRLVLTACADGTVRVWDLATGRLAMPPLDHDDAVTQVAFDSDGRRVVMAGEDRIVRIWDSASGRPHGPPLVHAFPVRYAAFSTEGRVVTTTEDNVLGQGEACVWNTATRNLVFRRATTQKVAGVTPTDRGIRRAWFSADGRYALVLNGSGLAQVWDTTKSEPVTDILEHKSTVNGASFSPDASRLLTDTFVPEHSLRLWEAAGMPLKELYRRLRPDNTATLWELPAGTRAASIGEPGAATVFRNASFSPDGKLLILIRDGAAEMRDAATGQLIRSFRKPGTAVTRAALSPDCRTLVTASDDRTAQLWNAVSGEIIASLPQLHPAGQKWQPLFSRNGRLLVLSSLEGVRIWDAATGDPISPPLIHPTEVEYAAFSPDGRLLLTASDQAAKAWPLYAAERNADEFLLLAQLLCCARMQPEGSRLMPLRSDEVAAAWEEIRTKLPNEFTTPPEDAAAWYAEAARACERNLQWDAAASHLARLVARDPARSDLFDRRGRAYAELGRWADAAADFQKATELGADQPGPWYRHALVRLHLEEKDAYGRNCAELHRRFGSSEDPITAQTTIWTCVLGNWLNGNGAAREAAKLTAAAERLVVASPKDQVRLRTLGAAYYRSGRHDDAVRLLNASIENKGKEETILAELFLAMAHRRLGQIEMAKTYLERAGQSVDATLSKGARGGPAADPLIWSRRLELTILRREAEAVLKEPSP
jgi:eukaryotic-like serine/threonine-protein kinase